MSARLPLAAVLLAVVTAAETGAQTAPAVPPSADRTGPPGSSAATGTAVAVAPDELPAVPHPAVDNLQAADRELVEAARAEADALLERYRAAPGPGLAAELGEEMGQVGRLYHLHDLPAAAIAAFETAWALVPGDMRWHYYLGTLHRAEGDLARAEASFERAAELAPRDLASHLRLGEVRLETGDVEAARESYAAALELDPASAAAHHGLGRIAAVERDFERAIGHFERALELQPTATSVHHHLGMAYRALGDLDAARRHLAANLHNPVTFPDPLVDRLPRLLRGARVHLKAGNRAAEAGQLEAAVAAYRKAREADPEDPLVEYNLGWALAAQGESEEAVAHFRRALEIDPDYRNAHFNLAAILAESGRPGEAAEHYRRAWEIDPKDHRARLSWGLALAAAGSVPEARRALGELVADPAVESELRLRGALRLAELAEAAGEVDAALGRLDAAAALAPAAAAPHLARGRLLGRAGRYEEAAAAFERAIERAPDDDGAHVGRAMSLIFAGRWAEARDALEARLRAARRLPVAHLLARLLATAPDPAVRDGRRALEIAERVFRSHATPEHGATVAMAHAELGDFTAAREWQRRVIERLSGERAEAARRRLAAYDAGEPVRDPWSDGAAAPANDG